MKRVKEIFIKLKEIWKVPKYKGLMQIGLWIIFFALVFLFIKAKNQIKYNAIEKTNETTNKEEKVNEITGYLYNYQINDGVSIINISGTYYNGIDLFTFNNNRYYLKNNLYYNALDNTQVNFDYSLREYQYNNIANLIKDKTFESKTEYKDGTLEYTYLIDRVSYNSFYNLNYQTEGNVILKVTYKDDIIVSANLDLSSYLASNYQVIISYSNVNNINGLDINIE